MLNATPTNKTCTHTKVAYAHPRETSAHIKETYKKDLNVCGLSVDRPVDGNRPDRE